MCLLKKLVSACRDNDIQKAKKVLRFRFLFSINKCDKFYGTPLMIAKSPKMISLLLNHGAKINKIVKQVEYINGKKTIDEKTVLCSHNVINRTSDPNILKCLLENGADPNILLTNNNIKGQTPIYKILQGIRGITTSSHHDQNEILLKKIDILVIHGADLNIQDENGDTPLIFFLNESRGDNKIKKEKIVMKFIKNGANLNLYNNNGENASSIASKYKNHKIDSLIEDNVVKSTKITPKPFQKSTNIIINKYKKVKKSHLQCKQCGETYNFRTIAGMMTDEKVTAIFSKAKIAVINNNVKLNPDLINKRYTLIGKVFRFLGNSKGVPKHVRYCFINGIQRKWTCEKCQKVYDYPDSFIKYWSR